jgi:uncharacterized protein
MVRRLIWLFAAAGLIWAVRALLSPSPHRGPRSRGKEPPPGGIVLVHDRVCNSCLPRDEALKLSVQGREHYFCSERCREAFLAQR